MTIASRISLPAALALIAFVALPAMADLPAVAHVAPIEVAPHVIPEVAHAEPTPVTPHLAAMPVLAAAAVDIVPIPVADPLVAATSTTDAGYALLLQYGWLWGSMALIFGAVSTWLKANGSKHWIAQGRTLAAIVAGSGLAGAALQAHFTGAPWSGVAVTAVLALFKLMQPTTIPTPAPAPSSPAASTTALLAVLLLGLGATQLPACGAAQHVGGIVVDCTVQDAGRIAVLIATLRTAPPAGCEATTGIDWSCVEQKAIAEGQEIGGCAISELVQQYLPPPAGTAAPTVERGQAARAALEQVRAQFGGVTWRTTAGVL